MTDRFKPIDPAALTPEQRQLQAALVKSPRGKVTGPYIPLIYSPDMAERMRHLGDFIRFEGLLPFKLKEIVILAVARHWSVQYMFALHRVMSADHRLDSAIVDAISDGKEPAGLTPQEAAAYALTRELLETGQVSDAAYAAFGAFLGEPGIIELVTFVGYYTTLAMILNTARMPLPEGGVPLPPRG